MLGLFRIPFLMREARLQVQEQRAGTLLGAALLGFAFAIGGSPCIGPILAGVLTLASTSETVGEGMLVLSGYGLGLGIPFLLAALAFDRLLGVSQQVIRLLGTMASIGGAILVVSGVRRATG